MGALHNASLAKIVYPNWTCRFYTGKTVPEDILSHLSEFNNVEIIPTNEDGNWKSTFWRFLAASDENIDTVIVRDCDSRLWYREKLAVEEWLKSDKDFHIIRDHPYHNVPILAGMWGVRNNFLKNMKTLCSQYNKEDLKQSDQNFLRDVIYPIVKDKSYTHDTFFQKSQLPGARDQKHFVGQVYAGCGRILDAEEYFQDFLAREYNAQRT